jgi:hypothetical protein
MTTTIEKILRKQLIGEQIKLESNLKGVYNEYFVEDIEVDVANNNVALVLEESNTGDLIAREFDLNEEFELKNKKV